MHSSVHYFFDSYTQFLKQKEKKEREGKQALGHLLLEFIEGLPSHMYPIFKAFVVN